MNLEYLTVECSLVKTGAMIFRFADDSQVKANHMQEFFNRQAALGWELLAVMPLSYVYFKPPDDEGVLLLNHCRLIFQYRRSNADTSDRDPPPGPGVPGRRLTPV